MRREDLNLRVSFDYRVGTGKTINCNVKLEKEKSGDVFMEKISATVEELDSMENHNSNRIFHQISCLFFTTFYKSYFFY